VALEAQLQLVGARQGIIIGQGASKPRDMERRVHFVTHEIVAPRSPATGLSTGKRHHKLLLLRREVSSATIGLHQAFASFENLTEVNLRFFQSSPLGVPKLIYTVQLVNAHICGLRIQLTPTRTTAKGTREARFHEEVSLAYLTINWTWHDPNMVATDDWMIAR